MAILSLAKMERLSHTKSQLLPSLPRSTQLGQMQTSSTCPTCNGDGKSITKKCTHCNGEGIMREDEVISIQIPAGVGEGMQLSMSGKGNAARRGGMNGDLLIVIEEEQDPNLIRDENDVYITFS